jgi:hypothetical protein
MGKTIKFIISFFLISAVFSCTYISKWKALDYKQFLKDSLTIITNSNYNSLKIHYSSKIFTLKNDDYLTLYNENSNSIEFYSLFNIDKNFNIKLPDKNIRVRDYKIVNLDSIYLIDKYDKLELCTRDTFNVLSIAGKIPYGSELALEAVNAIAPLEFYNNVLFVYNIPTFGELWGKSIKDRFFKCKYDLHLKRINDKLFIENVTGSYPSLFLSNFYSMGSLLASRIIDKNHKKIIYSFRCLNQIEIFDIEKNTSKIINLENPLFCEYDTFSYEKLKDSNFKKKYAIENDSYIFFQYDQYQNKYVRILAKGIKYDNNDGTVNSIFDKPLYVLIYYEDFKLEKTIKLPENKYNYLNILITSKGILISKNISENSQKNKINYDLYKFY